MMLITRPVLTLLCMVSMLLAAGMAAAQGYPNRPVRIITSEAGGDSNFMARLLGLEISPALGQQVIVDNRAGIIAVESVAKAPPDGYSLLFYGSVIWMEPLMRDNVPWDPLTDFQPVILVASSPGVIIAHPSLPVKSVQDLIALAKAKPGALNYGATSIGGPAHLATELFRSMTGVDMVRISYKGLGPALNELIGGQLHLIFATAGSALPHVRSGRARALAVTSLKPSALVPGLPTVAASGVPGYEWVSIYGVFAPGKTPAAIVDRLNQELMRAIEKADVKEKFFNAGYETVGSSPQQLAAIVKADMAKWGKVIRDAGIRSK